MNEPDVGKMSTAEVAFSLVRQMTEILGRAVWEGSKVMYDIVAESEPGEPIDGFATVKPTGGYRISVTVEKPCSAKPEQAASLPSA